MIFYHNNLVILANYAGVDYVALNKEFGPYYYIPVLYSPRPFGLFNFIRVPEQGYLRQKGKIWEFIADNKLKIAGNAETVRPFTMPGDRHSLWVEVKYNDGRHIAYFAEDLDTSIQPVSALNGLLLFLKKMIINDKLSPNSR